MSSGTLRLRRPGRLAGTGGRRDGQERTARAGAWRLHRGERLAGYTFVIPITALFAVFVGWPIIRAIYLGFTTWSGFGTPKFTGLANYTRMLHDPVAQHAFIVTIVYAVVTTILQTAIPLVVAVLLANVWTGLSVVIRTILFIPGIVSFVVSGVLWKLIYDPNLGLLNKALKSIGLGHLASAWLADPKTALPAIMIVSLWGAIGANMLIYFAGIQGVDPTYYEAAQIDGAGAWQQFRYITIPSLRIVTAIVLSLNLMNGFKAFDLIFVMTGGGPSHATEVFGTYLYSLAFGSTGGSIPQLGYGSAFSVIVMLMCGVAVLVQVTLSRRAQR